MEYTDQDSDADFKWFVSIYYDLYKKNGHKYYAIRNKTILGMYDNQKDALDTILKTYPLGTFLIQECNGDESGYTLKAPPAMWI